MSAAGSRFLCVHGHFYQPPRSDPFSDEVLRESGAEPYLNFNEKIAAECYRPNAALGTFSYISFDLGPTLASWLERHERLTYRRILAQEPLHVQRHGCSNAMAQVYSHAILPLATDREKRIQVAWGIADYRHRFGHTAPGVWLAETAVDTATLAVLADYGVGFTVLSPYQAAGPLDDSEPYLVRLPDGRAMTVFFYNGPLSGGVSFDAGLTANADVFGAEVLTQHLNREKKFRGERQLLFIATDGELYGHHQPYREQFLSHLLRKAAPAQGLVVTSPARYLLDNPPRREVELFEPSAWSCWHGVDRWQGDCGCTEGDGRWKSSLRRALTNLATRLDARYAGEADGLVEAPWVAEAEYIQVRLGAQGRSAFWRRHARRPQPAESRARMFALLEGQYYRHLMFTSCAYFFDDLDRLEPRIAIASGLRAIRAGVGDDQAELEVAFAVDLGEARSWRTGRCGADLLAEIASERAGLAGAA